MKFRHVGLCATVMLGTAMATGAVASEPRADTCQDLPASSAYVRAMLEGSLETGQRLAFVVGNGAYEGVGRLPNPTNDATAVAARLQNMGFRVFLALDARDATITSCFAALEPHLAKTDLAIFYYAGHGIQIDDDNYLIGVNAQPGLAGRSGLVRAADITSRLSAAVKTTLVFLDACRNNPFAADGLAGLAVADTRIIPVVDPDTFDKTLRVQPPGIMVTYATSPNATALDGQGRHSPFTEAFLDVVGRPGYSIQQSISEIGRLVGEATGYGQTPWSRSSLASFLYLNGEWTEEAVATESERRAKNALANLYAGRRDLAIAGVLSAFPRPTDGLDPAAYPAANTLLRYALSRNAIHIDLQRATDLAFSPDGSRAAIVTQNDAGAYLLQLWDTATRQRVAELATFMPYGTDPALVFSGDSQRLLARTAPASASVWDTADGAWIADVAFAGPPEPTGIRLDQSGQRVLSLYDQSVLLAVDDIAAGKRVLALGADAFVSLSRYGTIGHSVRAAFVRDDRIVMHFVGASCTYQFGHVTLATGTITLSPPTPPLADQCNANFINYSADGRRALLLEVLGGVDNVMNGVVLDTATGNVIYREKNPFASEWRLSPDGRVLLGRQDYQGPLPDLFLEGAEGAGETVLLLRDHGAIYDLKGNYLNARSDYYADPLWLNVPAGGAIIAYAYGQLDAAARTVADAQPIRFYPLQ